MYTVQQLYDFMARAESWREAPSFARVEFQCAMRDKEYDDTELLRAWFWFMEGWTRAAGMLIRK